MQAVAGTLLDLLENLFTLTANWPEKVVSAPMHVEHQQ